MEPVSAKKNRFRELAELLPETVFEMDLSGRISYFNPAGIAEFGYTRKDYPKGASFFDYEITRWDAWKALFHPQDVRRIMKASRRYIKGESPHFEVEGRVSDKQGHERWVLVRGVAERDVNGHVRRMIGSATDITLF